MRRGISIFLILFFWLGPLAANLPASEDDSRLPSCCRRHGAHHCAMSTRMAAIRSQAGSAPVAAAPSHCPSFPDYQAASTTPVYALAASTTDLPVLLAQAHPPTARRAAARLSQIRARAVRGPPASNLS
jgi:hypothetical protein